MASDSNKNFIKIGVQRLKRKGGDVLLRHEISLKVICEKVKFSDCEFCNNFRDKSMVHARADVGAREGHYEFT